MRIRGRLKGMLQSNVRISRRETIYKFISKKNDGQVPCLVCGKHVIEKYATLEHIIPTSKGGTDDMNNLSISHNRCNVKRGAPDVIGALLAC